MKLVDLRKLSIRQQIRIRFRLGCGLECVVTEHGIAQVPGLRAIPDFNLEQELASASEFVLEPAETGSASQRKGAPQARQIGRGELASMVARAGPGAATPEHEEE
jgi:hypothetical protein